MRSIILLFITVLVAAGSFCSLSSCSKEQAHIEKIVLNSHTLYMVVGEEIQLSAELTPPLAIPVAWSSSDNEVLTVNDEGVVTAISKGTAIVTASVEDVSTQCQITVEEPAKGI